jgi:hypothetical protein
VAVAVTVAVAPLVAAALVACDSNDRQQLHAPLRDGHAVIQSASSQQRQRKLLQGAIHAWQIHRPRWKIWKISPNCDS